MTLHFFPWVVKNWNIIKLAHICNTLNAYLTNICLMDNLLVKADRFISLMHSSIKIVYFYSKFEISLNGVWPEILEHVLFL